MFLSSCDLQDINVLIDLTKAHKGYYKFSLCQLKNPNTYEKESCFKNLMFANGKDRFVVPGTGKHRMKVKLPNGVKCDRCVFRWIYRAGAVLCLRWRVTEFNLPVLKNTEHDITVERTASCLNIESKDQSIDQ